MVMIDGFRPPRRPTNLTPRIRSMTDNIVSGDHSKDRFVPPNEVAAAEEVQDDTTTAANLVPGQMVSKKKRSFGEWLKGLSGKKKALLISLIILFIAGAGA